MLLWALILTGGVRLSHAPRFRRKVQSLIPSSDNLNIHRQRLFQKIVATSWNVNNSTCPMSKPYSIPSSFSTLYVGLLACPWHVRTRRSVSHNNFSVLNYFLYILTRSQATVRPLRAPIVLAQPPVLHAVRVTSTRPVGAASRTRL